MAAVVAVVVVVAVVAVAPLAAAAAQDWQRTTSGAPVAAVLWRR